jgi:hypothetical protein
MFGQAAVRTSSKAARAPATPCWDVLVSRYSDDASDQSDEESPGMEICPSSPDAKGRRPSNVHDEEESEDDDEALESAVWAAVHNGTSPGHSRSLGPCAGGS